MRYVRQRCLPQCKQKIFYPLLMERAIFAINEMDPFKCHTLRGRWNKLDVVLERVLLLIHIHEPEHTPHAPHHFVTEIRIEELVWARTRDDRDAIDFAFLHRLLRDTGHA